MSTRLTKQNFVRGLDRARELGLWYTSIFLLKKALATILPPNRTSDRVVAFLDFTWRNKRAPKQSGHFNDFLYRIKTSDEIMDPARVYTSDKEHVKTFIAGICGPQYNIPTIAVLRSKEEVMSYEFPDRCAIKPTHSSGMVMLRLSASQEVDRRVLNKWLSYSYYKVSREANYKYLRPKIMIEPLLFDRDSVDDIKFFCFRGVVKLIQWDFDRRVRHTRRLYDANWRDLGCSSQYPLSKKLMEKPSNLDEMKRVAGRLSQAFDFVRVDMYTDGSRFYVGEITHNHQSSGGRFYPPEAEKLVTDILLS